MRLDLEGKRALVAGASRGIGLEIAAAFLEENAQVTAVARTAASLSSAVKLLQKEHGERIKAWAGDMSVTSEIERCFLEAGPFDIVVINYGDTESSVAEQKFDADLERLLVGNLIGPLRLARKAALHLADKDGGSIVLIGSIAGRERLGAPLGYAVGKHGLAAVVKGLSAEFAARSVRVNLVEPGNVFFEGGRWQRRQERQPEAVGEMLAAKVPMKRFGTPREIADVVLFVASPRASFVTGARLVVDGGQTAAF